ncbi:MAG: ABC transporter ATP-binding protein [Clostridia bacterium]|nr:ABC transporter ATP-binding protein [Clostridia bacterium]
MNSENAVELKNIEMHFNMSKEKLESLKEYFLRLVTRKLMFEDFVALDNVSFDIKKGDVFGIVGLNGCGKSTTLKIISGILTPTKGTVETQGTIAPLIELGAGFDFDLTARENIYLNGSVLGYSKKFMDSKFDDIVEFSEMHDFLDTPMKNYSSGMIARIGFAIATVTQPEILIVDEILAVGDFRFQEKCEARINQMITGDTTVIIVSHSIEQIERLCNRCVWLEKGKVKMLGDAKEVCEAYRNAYR